MKYDLLQGIWDGAKILKRDWGLIMKYYQKQKAINDCLARGGRMIEHVYIKYTLGIGQKNFLKQKKNSFY